MSNYSKTTDFEAKDSLPTGDSGKIIRGAEFETEFDAISTAIATKADTAGPTFTGTLTFETISDGTIGVTAFVDEDNMASDSATLVPTQQSVKAYVDSQVTAQDLDFQADTGGALSIDLDSETMTFTGGTGIDTSGLGNAVTFAIDSTVATLTGTQTLTNKTLTSPDVNTPDIDGGTIDGTVIGGTTPAAVSATTVSATGNITVDGTVDGRDVATDGSKLDGIEAGATADQTAAEIRTLVEAATDSNVFTDADHSKLDGIEAGATGDQTNAEIRAAVEAATDSNVFTDADHSKLDGIEALADVTDTTNVTAAGALMDSELTSEASVKALNQGVATTDSPTFAAVTVNGNVEFDGLSGTGAVTVTDILDQDDMSSNSATALATQQSIKAYVDTTVAATNELVEDTTPQLGGDLESNGNDILFADNDKAIFGAGSDLQIYHDPSAGSIIQEAGAGSLFVRASTNIQLEGVNGENMAIFNENGSVQLYYDNAEKLATTSTGIDVTGSVVSDGLTVDGATLLNNGTNSTHLTLTGTTSRGLTISTTNTGGQNDSGAIYDAQDTAGGGVGSHEFRVGGESKLLISADGDISFYNSAGTSQDLFWDASTSRLGLGTTAPARDLHIVENDDWAQIRLEGNSSGGAEIMMGDSTTESKGRIQYVNASNYMRFDTNATERMRIDSSGNVGIGTSSPSFGLSVESDNGSGYAALFRKSSSDPALAIQTTSGITQIQGLNSALNATYGIAMQVSGGNVGIGTSSPSTALHVNSGVTNEAARFESTDTEVVLELKDTTGTAKIKSRADFRFETGATPSEAMRIDSSANLLVGQSSTALPGAGNTTTGISVSGQYDALFVSRAAGASGVFNRNSDGEILQFRKDGSTVGSIGTAVGNAYYAGTATGITFGSANLYPTNASGTKTDGALDLGSSSQRFKDLYLSGGAYLGGTASANHLDDYEEGTWTPVVQGSAGGAYTYSGATARYTKIGNLVTVTCQLTNITVSGTGHSGYLQIAGLPFTKRTDHMPAGSAAISSINLSTNMTYATSEFISASSTAILYVHEHGDNNAGSSLPVTAINSGTSDVILNIQYVVS